MSSPDIIENKTLFTTNNSLEHVLHALNYIRCIDEN